MDVVSYRYAHHAAHYIQQLHNDHPPQWPYGMLVAHEKATIDSISVYTRVAVVCQ